MIYWKPYYNPINLPQEPYGVAKVKKTGSGLRVLEYRPETFKVKKEAIDLADRLNKREGRA